VRYASRRFGETGVYAFDAVFVNQELRRGIDPMAVRNAISDVVFAEI